MPMPWVSPRKWRLPTCCEIQTTSFPAGVLSDPPNTTEPAVGLSFTFAPFERLNRMGLWMVFVPKVVWRIGDSSLNVIFPLPDNSRSEEHTSELQSPDHLVCRLLLEKK